MRRPAPLLALALGAGALLPAAPAAAQTPVAEPPGTEPAPPSAPDLVLSGRHIRLTRTGVVGIRMGCRGERGSGEACIGSVIVRLSSVLTEVYDPPGPRRTAQRRIFPFNFGVQEFTLVTGDATQLRFRISRRAQRLVRDHQQVRVDLIVSYNSRAGATGSARRNVRVYFPTRPGR